MVENLANYASWNFAPVPEFLVLKPSFIPIKGQNRLKLIQKSSQIKLKSQLKVQAKCLTMGWQLCCKLSWNWFSLHYSTLFIVSYYPIQKAHGIRTFAKLLYLREIIQNVTVSLKWIKNKLVYGHKNQFRPWLSAQNLSGQLQVLNGCKMNWVDKVESSR